MLAPNRQNLLLLQKQFKSLKNGLRLLREKRTGLVILFLERSKQGKDLEAQLSTSWKVFLQKYNQILAFLDSDNLSQSMLVLPATNLDLEIKRVVGVYITNLKLSLHSPERPELKPEIQSVLDDFSSIWQSYVKLIELKENCLKISQQIQKTNRQIANIENKIVSAGLEIKFIQNTLSEKANAEKATLIKIFNS